jgi:aspartate/methionine/tyrosine aminotransferase
MQAQERQFQDFELERYQSLHEHTVQFNLADSSVKCVGTREWLDAGEQEDLLNTGLFYPQVNGTQLLRTRIAALYPGASADSVLVTVGAAQANAMVCSALLSQGDELVVVSPGYRQVWGLALNAGCVVKEAPRDPDQHWRLDLDQLESLISPRTRLVSIVNPNNPTGSILSEVEVDRIVAACARVGAWLHADEVYASTEVADGVRARSFWGRYDRLICVNSLSKAYGLSGLRVGWLVSAPAMIEALWRRHEYAVIAAAAPSMTLAAIALQPEKSAWLIERQRRMSRAGRALLRSWIEASSGLVSVAPSAATCLGFVRYDLPINSYDVAERIREQASVLVAPGSYLGAEGHLRITVGYDEVKVSAALDRIGSTLRSLRRSG